MSSTDRFVVKCHKTRQPLVRLPSGVLRGVDFYRQQLRNRDLLKLGAISICLTVLVLLTGVSSGENGSSASTRPINKIEKINTVININNPPTKSFFVQEIVVDKNQYKNAPITYPLLKTNIIKEHNNASYPLEYSDPHVTICGQIAESRIAREGNLYRYLESLPIADEKFDNCTEFTPHTIGYSINGAVLPFGNINIANITIWPAGLPPEVVTTNLEINLPDEVTSSKLKTEIYNVQLNFNNETNSHELAYTPLNHSVNISKDNLKKLNISLNSMPPSGNGVYLKVMWDKG